MKTWAKQTGFTIVELLIVIVVIAVLAAITIVAYNGIQARARDNIRYQDAKAIVEALELYKADKGYYPSWTQDDSWRTTASPCGSGHTNGYSYSTATDNSWMKPLVTGGYLQKIPTPPGGSCTSYYRYLNTGNAGSYNCPSRTTTWYILEIVGIESAPTPSDASDPSGGGNWVPCTGATAGWGAGASTWAFTKDDV